MRTRRSTGSLPLRSETVVKKKLQKIQKPDVYKGNTKKRKKKGRLRKKEEYAKLLSPSMIESPIAAESFHSDGNSSNCNDECSAEKLVENEESTVDNGEDITHDSSCDEKCIVNGKKTKISSVTKLKKYRKYYSILKLDYDLNQRREASSDQKSEWYKEFCKNKKVVCESKFCRKVLKSTQAMVYHYERACLKIPIMFCEICKQKISSQHSIVLAHFVQEHKDIEKYAELEIKYYDEDQKLNIPKETNQIQESNHISQTSLKKECSKCEVEKTRFSADSCLHNTESDLDTMKRPHLYGKDLKNLKESGDFSADDPIKHDSKVQHSQTEVKKEYLVKQKYKRYYKAGELRQISECKKHISYLSDSLPKRKCTDNLKIKWTNEYNQKGSITCKEEFCRKTVSSVIGMMYHYEKSCFRSCAKCNICQKFIHSKISEIFAHFSMDHFNIIANIRLEKQLPLMTQAGRQCQSELLKQATANFWKSLRENYKSMPREKTDGNMYESVMPEWKPLKDSWKKLQKNEYMQFLPPLRKSVRLMIEHAEFKWRCMERFESCNMYLPDDSKKYSGRSSETSFPQSAFFVGGPVICAAWCPSPEGTTQFLALVTEEVLSHAHSFDKEPTKGGLIQIWNTGLLSKRSETKPYLALAIAHRHGKISELSWCSHGCWENPDSIQADTKNTCARLGLLAVACGDAYIRIYCIPHPEQLYQRNGDIPVYCAWPVAILRSSFQGSYMLVQKSICTSLQWQDRGKCELIAGGYQLGIICLWRINSTSSLLYHHQGTQKIVSPFTTFHAHTDSVMGIVFSPIQDSVWIVSWSLDGYIKAWDLKCSTPMYQFKFKGEFLCKLHWASDCGGMFVISNSQGLSAAIRCIIFPDIIIPLFPCSTVIKDSSLSEELHVLAVGDLSGQLSAIFAQNVSAQQGANNTYPTIILQTKVVPLDEDEAGSSHTPSPANSLVDEDENHLSSSTSGAFQDYSAITKKCGLLFKSKELVNDSEIHEISTLNSYPIAAINSVIWNPNVGSHYWLFAGCQSGVCFLFDFDPL